MYLSNPFEVVVHHILIGRMTSLGYWDGILLVSALVCLVAHLTGPTVIHDTRLSGSHDFTKLLCYIVSQPSEYIEFVPKLEIVLTYE